jgi:conjugal transfer/entry exclusion protein
MNWISEISKDITKLADFTLYCNKELADAKKEVSIKGNVEKNIAALPGIIEHRFNQLQEVEGVLKYLEIQLGKIRQKYFQKYLESYNRSLSSRDAEKYADGESEVIDYQNIINEVAFIRNQYLGIIKGIESKNFMLGHLVKLKTAGMEDYII